MIVVIQGLNEMAALFESWRAEGRNAYPPKVGMFGHSWTRIEL